MKIILHDDILDYLKAQCDEIRALQGAAMPVSVLANSILRDFYTGTSYNSPPQRPGNDTIQDEKPVLTH